MATADHFFRRLVTAALTLSVSHTEAGSTDFFVSGGAIAFGSSAGFAESTWKRMIEISILRNFMN